MEIDTSQLEQIVVHGNQVAELDAAPSEYFLVMEAAAPNTVFTAYLGRLKGQESEGRYLNAIKLLNDPEGRFLNEFSIYIDGKKFGIVEVVKPIITTGDPTTLVYAFKDDAEGRKAMMEKAPPPYRQHLE